MSRKQKIKYVFTPLEFYENTDSILAGYPKSFIWDTEIDGHEVLAFMNEGRCLAMWFVRAGKGSYCLQFQSDALSYSEYDPNWPYD